MHQAKFLTIFPLFIAWANGYSVLQGKSLNVGDNSYLEIERLAEPVLQKRGISLKRQDDIGAWSLRAVKCPENTQQCDMGYPAMEVCCPKNFVCVSNLFKIACCATESSCIETAATFPKCADPSWTLWAGSREDYFCCQAGQIGYVTSDNSAACGPDTLKPTGKQVATSIAQGNDNSSPQTSAPSSSDDNGTSSSPLPDPSTSVDSSPSSSSSDYPTVTNFPSGTDDDPTGTPDNQGTDNDGSGSKQSSNTSSSGSSSSSSGLSTGAIAGIAAGGVLLLILAGVAVFFALRAGKKKGAAQAMAAFQQQQRSLPGPGPGSSPGGLDNRHANPDYYQSGPGTPRGGAFATGNQGYGQETEIKPQLVPGVAEKYGQGAQVPPAPVSSPPPQQWSPPPQEPQGHPTYEADSTTYQNSRYEMEGYNNQQRF